MVSWFKLMLKEQANGPVNALPFPPPVGSPPPPSKMLPDASIMSFKQALVDLEMTCDALVLIKNSMWFKDCE